MREDELRQINFDDYPDEIDCIECDGTAVYGGGNTGKWVCDTCGTTYPVEEAERQTDPQTYICTNNSCDWTGYSAVWNIDSGAECPKCGYSVKRDNEPVALVYDEANGSELIARCYTGESAQELADAWWTRVEWQVEPAYKVHCDRCDMHTGKMSRDAAIEGAGTHAVETGHEVSVEQVIDRDGNMVY